MKKLLFMLSCLFLTGHAALAAGEKTITVTSSADSGTGTLREAIANADANDIIIFADDITTIYFSGLIKLDKNITISGNETNNTIFQNGAVWTDNTNKKWYIEVLANATVTLNHLTLKDNTSNCTGGALVNRGTLTLNNCIFSNNRPYDSGGAISSSGNLTAYNCTFINNYAPRSAGAISSIGNTYLEGCTFKNNSSGSNGGALYLGNSTVLVSATIKDCIFEGNRGYLMNAITNYSKATIDNCVFRGNKSSDEETTVYNNAEMTISNSLFEENQGCAIKNSPFTHLVDVTTTVTNCLFIKNYFIADNTSLSGRGILQNGRNATLNVINSTIADNTAIGFSANNNPGSGSTDFTNTYLYNNIFYNNITATGYEYDIFVNYDTFNPNGNDVFTNAHNNIIGKSNDLSFNATNLLEEDPLFIGDADYSLQENSPALDAGNNNYLSIDITTDLAKNKRICNKIVDLGVYEFQVDDPIIDDPDPDDDPTAVAAIQHDDLKIYTLNRTIIIENATAAVSIYDTTGKLAAQGTGNAFTMPYAGIYIVRMGETAHKIIVY